MATPGAGRLLLSCWSRPVSNLFECARICRYVLRPQLVHQHLDILRPEVVAIGEDISQAAHSHVSRVGTARMRRESRVSRLMGNSLRSDIELISPNWFARHCLSPSSVSASRVIQFSNGSLSRLSTRPLGTGESRLQFYLDWKQYLPDVHLSSVEP
jgi:hypothetical protein